MLWPLLAFLIASFIHFAHNAEFLSDYPHMPPWLTRGGVYASWLAIAAAGIAGYAIVRRGGRTAGRLLLTLAGMSGVLVLTHYLAAPPSMHTPAMNATIVAEAVMAAILLFATWQRKL